MALGSCSHAGLSYFLQRRGFLNIHNIALLAGSKLDIEKPWLLAQTITEPNLLTAIPLRSCTTLVCVP